MSMKRVVLTFGLISGAISSAMMLATLPFADRLFFDYAAVLGYTTIVLSFLLVFFGIRSYRENTAGGSITFGQGFTVGILITLVSCVCYVATWEFIYFKLRPDFVEKYSAYIVEHVKASGASQQEVAAKVQQMESFKVAYDKPWINVAMTFVEPFPIGLLVTVISAAVLRKKGTVRG